MPPIHPLRLLQSAARIAFIHLVPFISWQLARLLGQSSTRPLPLFKCVQTYGYDTVIQLTSILFSLQNADTQNCQHTSVFCNCDADEPRWLSDEGFLTQPEELGITQIFALQQRHLIPQGEGRITLGPLECVEASKKNDTHDKESNEKYPTLVILQSPVLHHFDILQIRSSTS